MKLGYWGDKLIETLYKGVIWAFAFVLFQEFLVFLRYAISNDYLKYQNGWSWVNVITNFYTFFIILISAITINFFKELLYANTNIKKTFKKISLWVAKKLNSPGIFYKSMYNTATIHVDYLDDFIDMFFSRTHGKISLFNPDKKMFVRDSKVFNSLISAISSGDIRRVSISSDELSDFVQFQEKLKEINKSDILTLHRVPISVQTPRFAAYFGPDNAGFDPLYFMWRPKISPQKDKIVHIIRSNHYKEFSYDGVTNFPQAVQDLIDRWENDNFNLNETATA